MNLTQYYYCNLILFVSEDVDDKLIFFGLFASGGKLEHELLKVKRLLLVNFSHTSVKGAVIG